MNRLSLEQRSKRLKSNSMKVNATLTLLLFLSTLFYNCSPIPITKVDLQDSDVGYWQKGSAIGEKVVDDVVVEAVFSHVDKEYMYFDVAFENIGDERVLINPKDFQLVDTRTGGMLKAIDPELRIISMEVKQARKEANNKTLAIVASAVVVAGTIAAVASSDGGSDSDTGTTDAAVDDCVDDYYLETLVFADQTAQNLPPMEYEYFSHEPLLSVDARMLPNAKGLFFWEEFTFRKSTLFPNQRMRGLVVFLKNKFLKESRLVIPVGTNEVTFDFVHREY